MLEGLPKTPTWESLRGSIEVLKIDKTPEVIADYLTNHWAMLKRNGTLTSSLNTADSESVKTNETAMAAKAGPFKGSCFECGKVGHQRKECRSKHLWNTDSTGQKRQQPTDGSVGDSTGQYY